LQALFLVNTKWPIIMKIVKAYKARIQLL